MPVLGLYQSYGGSGEICGSKKIASSATQARIMIK